ncbi:MAG: XdhC family protein [Bacteroidota bacterium]
MKEIQSIIETYEALRKEKRSCVLATVVHVEGSSYRRAGARMLVDENGEMTGAISGGCLEGDALRKALHALTQVKNKLVTYDTSDEEDAVIGAQLGCNGVIQVLFEPIDYEEAHNPVELLKKAIKNDDEAIVVTFFNLKKSAKQPGTQLLFTDTNTPEVIGLLPQTKVFDQVKKDVDLVFKNRASVFRSYQGEEGSEYFLFIEYFSPPITLVLVGAGNDAQVLAKQADILGWNIIIADGRPSHASTNRFASSCQLVVAHPESLFDSIQPTDRMAFVLMTHNYQYDLSVLKLLLDQPVIPYIGILGPYKKYHRMLDDLRDERVFLSEEQSSKIHAPVGLEIGAESPAEIGLSILAEIQAVFTQTPGSFLKNKQGPIHKKKNSQFETIKI